MALFAKNKPTKRVNFEGGFVELQFLSKGVKDDIKQKILDAVKGFDVKKLDLLQKQNTSDPENAAEHEELPVEMINKINETSYIALANAIKSWSEDSPITIETVRELDDNIFEKILTEVNKMNQLEMGERKN